MLICPTCKKQENNIYAKINDWVYSICHNCLSLFLINPPKQDKVNKYYENNFIYDLDEITNKRIQEQAIKIINQLIKLNPEGKKLLDIGSAHGFLLNEAKKYEIDTIGIEPSKKLFLATKSKNKIINSSFDDVNIKQVGTFDFITSIHVIEHLENPTIFAEKVYKLLNKKGILVVETPNFDSWLRIIENESYTFLTPPDHLFIFSIKSLKKIFPEPKWKIILIEQYTYPEHLIGIIRKIKNMLFNKYKSLTLTPQKQQIITQYRKNIPLIDFIGNHLYKITYLFHKGSIIRVYIIKT